MHVNCPNHRTDRRTGGHTDEASPFQTTHLRSANDTNSDSESTQRRRDRRDIRGSSQSPRAEADEAVSGQQNCVCSFAVFLFFCAAASAGSSLFGYPSCAGIAVSLHNLSCYNHLEYYMIVVTWAAAFTCFGISASLVLEIWSGPNWTAVGLFKTVALICCPSRHLIVLVVYLSLPAACCVLDSPSTW